MKISEGMLMKTSTVCLLFALGTWLMLAANAYLRTGASICH